MRMAQFVLAGAAQRAFGVGPHGAHGWNEQPEQNANDRNHDQHFRQREAAASRTAHLVAPRFDRLPMIRKPPPRTRLLLSPQAATTSSGTQRFRDTGCGQDLQE